MTTTVPRQTALEVGAFVAQVRSHLEDLTEEEREELTGGLEADLAAQLADGAVWSELGEPRAYAAELRQAAGLPPVTRRLTALPRLQRPRVPAGEDVAGALDRGREDLFRLVGSGPRTQATWDVLVQLRPLWWVVRAWIAVTLLDVVAGGFEPVSLVPSLDHPLVGPVLLVIAVAGSIWVGLDRVWPGSGPQRAVTARVVLLLLNVLALLAPLSFDMAGPGYLSSYPQDGSVDEYSTGYSAGRESIGPGLHVGRKRVTNVFAYGPGGKPIPAVQLFDQDGAPLAQAATAATGRRADRRVPCPAYNGTTPLFNVFPLDQAPLRRGTCQPDTAGRATPIPPLVEVPPLASAPSGER